MNEPQVWTLIGVFSAAVFGMFGLVSTMFVRIMRAEFGALEARLTSKIDLLDREIQALARQVFGDTN